ncbi:hypothetical protein F4804DRAFT_101345, partial [Jackrogersella minutella]
MGDICPAPESYGASHTRMSENNMKFCHFCGASLSSRTNQAPIPGDNDDDSILITDSSSWKPNNRPKKKTSSDNFSPADILARVPRRPAPKPLIPKREYSPIMTTAIPAASEMERRSATNFLLYAAEFSNTVRDRSSKKNPPHSSSSNWFAFNITISITKWKIDLNDPLPIPIYISGSFQIVHNYDTTVKGSRITDIDDWWDRFASTPYVRKVELEKVYKVAFFKNLTKTSFTDLDIEARRALDIRTVWDSLPPAKSHGGKEHRKIHVTYQNITYVEKESDEEKEEDLSEEEVKVKVKKERK